MNAFNQRDETQLVERTAGIVCAIARKVGDGRGNYFRSVNRNGVFDFTVQAVTA